MRTTPHIIDNTPNLCHNPHEVNPMKINVRYHYHSGFSLAIDQDLLIFDYWTGEHNELPESVRITLDDIKACDQVYVFVSHEHPDHYDPVIKEWQKEPNVTCFIAPDLPNDVRGNRMWPGDLMRVNSRLTVQAFDSTDLGVSFLIKYDGFSIFHAGDLNFWHWREESTIQEIEEADLAFRTAVTPIVGQNIDLCFFPVDPRQGRLYDAGVNYFAMAVKPRLIVPMHFWGRTEIIDEYARRTRSNQTEIVVLANPGDRMELEIEEDGYMMVELMPTEEPPMRPDEMTEGSQIDMAGYDGEDPFFNTDEPVEL